MGSDVRTSDRLRLRLSGGTTWVSHLLQDVVAACLSSPDVAARVAARADYARRRADMARIGWLVRAGEGFGIAVPPQGLRLTVAALAPAEFERFAVSPGRRWTAARRAPSFRALRPAPRR